VTKVLRFGPVLRPRQGTAAQVVCFNANADQIAQIARIERIGRDEAGLLRGFQRPQIASHIREIGDYLAREDAILPNAIVLAFNSGARVQKDGFLVVDISDGPPGWVVDGQQRFTAALGLKNRDFELIVSAFVSADMAELNRQFILVNNTKPLPKQLIYELLPSTEGLPDRLSDRTDAAVLTEALNYWPTSSLLGCVHQQTNPNGVIKDTLLQRMLLNSMQNGALRALDATGDVLEWRFNLVSSFFEAVRMVFARDWDGHNAKSSRLLHGVGIISMGYVMDELHTRVEACTAGAFLLGLQPLAQHTRWTSGEWSIGKERRPWNTVQNTNADYRLISHHLVRLIRHAPAPALRKGGANRRGGA
jgi:DGQHR domain-containing protein